MTKEELKAKIVSANSAYRDGSPVMDDLSYDGLLEQYKELVSDSEFEEFVSTLHEKSGKAKLPYIMGSLTKLKCSEPETIVKFVEEKAKDGLNVSAKVDGISACLVYEKGRLVHAMTRGDGYNGEWLDDKIMFVKGVIAELPEKIDIAVRGELVILKDDFKKMSGSNPRNVCAGIMNRKADSKEWNEADIRMVTFVPYTVLGDRFGKDEQFAVLEKLGFSTAWHKTFAPGYFDENGLNVVDELFKYATQDLPYEIDGCVVSSPSYRNEDKYRPDCQMAVKTNTMSAETTLIDISWDGPSKNGVFFPVAILEPVELGGAMIGRSTLNNLDYIGGLGIKYGCTVRISKRGDIIPAVDEVVSVPDNAKDITYPDTCSCCGSPLVRDGVNLRCVNPECRTQKIYQIEHFIKKLGVMNASFKTLENLGIDSYEKLISFVPDKKRKSETKLAKELETKVFTRSQIDIFSALNIRDLGETLQKKIVDFYGWDNINTRGFRFEGLPDGIGGVTLGKFIEAYEKNLEITRMFAADPRYSYSVSAKESAKARGSAKGSVCFTGSLSIPRGDASKLAEAAGFEVKSSVTKGLTYLVTPDPNSGSSKNEKAKKYGTKVIDEAEFMKLVDPNACSVADL